MSSNAPWRSDRLRKHPGVDMVVGNPMAILRWFLLGLRYNQRRLSANGQDG